MKELTDDTTEATGSTVRVLGPQQHPQRATCPTCKANLMRVGLNQIVYSFEVCEVIHDEANHYPHIYEQMWHREHFRANAPEFGWA